MMNGFEDLRIWQDAHALTLTIYELTKRFPKDENYGLTDQTRRAVASIGANIAESYGRYYFADVARFLYQARGSLQETRNHMMLARDLKYIDITSYNEISQELHSLAKSLNKYITVLKDRK